MEQILKPIAVEEFNPSSRKNKRYCIKFLMSDGTHKRIHFGDSRYKTYIDTKDKIHRSRYWVRYHKYFENMNITQAGYLSAMILYGSSSDINTNLTIFKQLFNLED